MAGDDALAQWGEVAGLDDNVCDKGDGVAGLRGNRQRATGLHREGERLDNMTVYVHFTLQLDYPARKLHNVARVSDNGKNSILVSMLFTDDKHTFVNVSHVAIQPERE